MLFVGKDDKGELSNVAVAEGAKSSERGEVRWVQMVKDFA